ncbi:hypothetical protein GCM10011613_17810 [Cellvibrio zantedeschiae]|uniref:Glycosyltransferase RgtA/B/C/D-like domain-containing protein n=2 Tax=Cellvibrio zantedeschiae TaxID=1237077 RepID=A0ABQ3B339_9GAMM|nr:hypothetical protein GCM10011613_17810 [Cellvibrio zantedeschiae]
MLMWISTWKSITLGKVEFSSNPNEHRIVSLPFSEDFVGRYTISVDLENVTSAYQEFRITPDDEVVAIRVNGENIPLNNIPHSDLRNYGSGFLMSFNNLKPDQTNVFQFDLVNESNPTGFRLETTQRLTTTQLIGIAFSLFSFALFLSRTLKISHAQKLFLLAGLIVSVMYLSKTDSRTRTFDVYEGGGHKDYIEHLIHHKNLPNPGEGWEYHQPPLYYLIAATAKVTGHIPEAASDLWAQLLALYFWVIFLVSGLACLHIAFRKRLVPLLISSLAFCLWPAGIIHSIRIGNDLGLYAFYGLSFFYTLKWWKTRASSDLIWASLWMGASLLTKSNGLAMTSTLGALFFLHMVLIFTDKQHFQAKKTKLIRDFSIMSAIFATALLLNFGDNIYYYLKGTSSDWLLSNVSESINSGLKVNNNLENYLVFDLATYVLHPFISTWDDISGRQYFWNFVWRSSLTSEFYFQGDALKYWGVSNGIFLLCALAGTCIYFLQKQPYTTRREMILGAYKYLPWILTLVLPFLLLLAYRIKVPLSCNTDFRYIYPVLINIIFFACLTWKKPKELPIPAVLTLGLGIIGASSLYWIKLI